MNCVQNKFQVWSQFSDITAVLKLHQTEHIQQQHGVLAYVPTVE